LRHQAVFPSDGAETTQIDLAPDLAMKEKALAKTEPLKSPIWRTDSKFVGDCRSASSPMLQ
jgi:hypothetical protein